MGASGEKPRKSEILQAVVQPGMVGFYPFNALGMTAIHFGQAQCLIAHRDDKQVEKLRTQAEFEVDGHCLNLQGKLFTGICDAFYRGKLPELLIVSSNMQTIPDFIEEFMDFLEKLCSLGFLSGTDMDEVATLDRYVPQIVISSYGVVYDVVLHNLDSTVSYMADISTRQRERLLQKFSRGFWTSPAEGYDMTLMESKVYDKPLQLQLAGSKSMYTVKTTQLLEKVSISCQFSPNGELGVLEWELNLAYKHLLHRILPILRKKKLEKSLKEDQLAENMETLGQKLGILPGMVTLTDSGKKAAATLSKYQVSHVDLAILHQLRLLARKAEDTKTLAMIETLLEKTQQMVSPAAASAIGDK